MSNERNVAALQGLLAQAAAGSLDAVPPPFQEMIQEGVRQTIAQVAEYLSDQGVLVPSVLTEDQAAKLGADAAGTSSGDRSGIARCVREALERIAKGVP